VEGFAPARRRFYLTDVTIARASVLLLGARIWPGVRIVRRDAVIPAGQTPRSYDRLLYDAMSDSQNAAAFVAERAAGYAVPKPAELVLVAGLLPGSHAAGVLRPDDRLVRIGNRTIRTSSDVSLALKAAKSHAPISLLIERSGRPSIVAVRPVETAAGRRLGVLVRTRLLAARLPIAVRFTIGDIRGSSGGLMFALAIYAQLRKTNPGLPVAGTGTLDGDGRVGPIEGTLQKLIAAKRAGAALFLVPRRNYAEIASQRGIRVVPVTTFREALAALDR
jgi:PDZ domain-containing secreted protein